MKKEKCIHCKKKMEPWTVVCPHCGGINGHNRINEAAKRQGGE